VGACLVRLRPGNSETSSSSATADLQCEPTHEMWCTGILRDFFKQCDKALPALHPSHDKLRCSGLALAGQHTPWSLKHNNDDAFRMDFDEGTDVYPVIAALQRAIFENARNRSRMRVSLRALRRDGMPRKVRGTHVMKT